MLAKWPLEMERRLLRVDKLQDPSTHAVTTKERCEWKWKERKERTNSKLTKDQNRKGMYAKRRRRRSKRERPQPLVQTKREARWKKSKKPRKEGRCYKIRQVAQTLQEKKYPKKRKHACVYAFWED